MALTTKADMKRLQTPLQSPSYKTVTPSSPMNSRVMNKPEFGNGNVKTILTPAHGIGRNPISPSNVLVPEPNLITLPNTEKGHIQPSITKDIVDTEPLITPKVPINNITDKSQPNVLVKPTVTSIYPTTIPSAPVLNVPDGAKWVNLGSKSEGYIDPATKKLVYANYSGSIDAHNLSLRGDATSSAVSVFKTGKTVIVREADAGLINNDAGTPDVGVIETPQPNTTEQNDITSNKTQVVNAGVGNVLVIVALVGVGVSLFFRR